MRLNDLRLKAIDLRLPIRLGVEHIYQGATNRRRGCLPLVRWNLTQSPAWARHEYWSSPHVVGRFLDALAVSAAIIDLPADEEVVEGLRQLLHDCLDNPTGFAFRSLSNPKSKHRESAMADCREVLLALTGLMEWRGCDRSRDLARRFVRTIEAATRDRGTFPAEVLVDTGWVAHPADENYPNANSGRLIGALVKYYRVSRDPVALDLAVRFAEYNLAHTFTPEGELTAAAGKHLHSTEGTVAAIIDLGILTKQADYIEIGKRLYDVGLRRWRTSFGWAKEVRDQKPGRGEANNTGDLIEAALLLGRTGYHEYFGDAERFIRNGLLASQIVNTNWIPEYDGTADTEDYIYSDVRRRARGAFAFTTPNDYHSYNTDLMGGAIQSLCEAWQTILTEDQAGLHVNLLFSKQSENLVLRSYLPEEGRVEVILHQAHTLFVRLPSWLEEETLEVRVNGERRPPIFHHHELFLSDLASSDRVELIFPQARQQTTERAPGYDESYHIDWLGDTIMDITPQGEIVQLY